MCGGFTCSKNTLVGLNVIYVMVSFLMIGVAVHGKTSGLVTSLPIVGGITACGIFLLIISVIGLIGAVRHHQVMLFCYMVTLFLIFLIQFSVSCAALAVSESDEAKIIKNGWNVADNGTKFDAEKAFGCCGLDDKFNEGVKCTEVPSCAPVNATTCVTCMDKIRDKVNYAFNAAGAVGLIFSFTELFGGIVALRYRNQLPENTMGGSPFGMGD
jgi:tetraspanin-13/31